MQVASDLFNALAEKTANPPGVTRKAYGEGERIAHELITDARLAGAEAEYDPAGNLFDPFQEKTVAEKFSLAHTLILCHMAVILMELLA